MVKDWKLFLRTRSGPSEGHPCPFYHFYLLQVQAGAIKQEKERKGTQIEKADVKLSLFADDTILYTENRKDYIRTQTHRSNKSIQQRKKL